MKDGKCCHRDASGAIEPVVILMWKSKFAEYYIFSLLNEAECGVRLEKYDLIRKLARQHA
jgi:hypothetical protein